MLSDLATQSNESNLFAWVTNNSEGDETKNISKLMKEITEQTNLLGLNVAIEGGFSDCLAFNN
ncbi:hypothetical protein ABES57_17335, partial [Brevibacillus laterosporus]